MATGRGKKLSEDGHGLEVQPWPCLMGGNTAGCTGVSPQFWGSPKEGLLFISHHTTGAKQGKKWPDLGPTGVLTAGIRRPCEKCRLVLTERNSGVRVGCARPTACPVPAFTDSLSHGLFSGEFTKSRCTLPGVPIVLLEWWPCSYKNSLKVIIFFICESDDIRVV